MPHDRNGRRIFAGDIVDVRFEVKQVYEGESACNVELEALPTAAAEGEYLPQLTTNAGLVQLVRSEVSGYDAEREAAAEQPQEPATEPAEV